MSVEQSRLVASFPKGDKLYGQCLLEAKTVGVGKTKLVRDALILAFAFQAGRLEPGRVPEGVACFRPKKRRSR